MRIPAPAAVALLVSSFLLSSTFAARAETHRVDDSASQVLSPALRMKWDSVSPQRGSASGVTGQTVVLARLRVSPWKGRQGRVFMTLPDQPGGPVTATWTTQGRLLPGTLRSGERTLVYNGAIPAELLEDTLRLTIHADGRRLVREEQLAFAFEIDLGVP